MRSRSATIWRSLPPRTSQERGFDSQRTRRSFARHCISTNDGPPRRRAISPLPGYSAMTNPAPPVVRRLLRSLTLGIAVTALGRGAEAAAQDRPEVVYKIFQFPADRIPRVDGKADDWAMVPAEYVIGTDQLVDDTKKHPAPDPTT